MLPSQCVVHTPPTQRRYDYVPDTPQSPFSTFVPQENGATATVDAFNGTSADLKEGVGPAARGAKMDQGVLIGQGRVPPEG